MYRIGDSTHRRGSGLDDLLGALPAAWAVGALFVLVVSRTNPHWFRAQWRRERAELRKARTYRQPSAL